MPYQWILFDADDTLFEFKSFKGLSRIMARLGVPFDEQDYQQFQSINQPLWQLYQQGKINAEELGRKRFEPLAAQTPYSASELNHLLQLEMASLSPPLDGVAETLPHLAQIARLALITNGFAAIQQPRLQHTGLTPYFAQLIVSEEIGVAKPHPQIFQAALAKMGNPSPQHVLMVGDNLVSDIQGAQSVGLQTCWYNPHKQHNSTTILPTFEIHHFTQLLHIAQST